MNIADEIGQLSYAERKKVGCIIVKDSSIISYGYNGTPTGFDNTCEELLTDSETEELYTITKKEVLHSESNAISKVAKSSNSSDGADMYVTLSPCFECSKLIIQAGIKRLFYREEYRLREGLELLEKAGIQCIQC
jgi:dCMP deaminase